MPQNKKNDQSPTYPLALVAENCRTLSAERDERHPIYFECKSLVICWHLYTVLVAMACARQRRDQGVRDGLSDRLLGRVSGGFLVKADLVWPIWSVPGPGPTIGINLTLPLPRKKNLDR